MYDLKCLLQTLIKIVAYTILVYYFSQLYKMNPKRFRYHFCYWLMIREFWYKENDFISKGNSRIFNEWIVSLPCRLLDNGSKRSRICSLYISNKKHLHVDFIFSSFQAYFSWHRTSKTKQNSFTGFYCIIENTCQVNNIICNWFLYTIY